MQQRPLPRPDGGTRAAFTMLRLDKGEEVMGALAAWAEANDVRAAHFTGIGAFERATLAFYDRASRAYVEHHVDEAVEVLSITGSIGVTDEGSPRVHAHVTLGMADLTARGGHLVAGTAWPTLEVAVTIGDGELTAARDDDTGLQLLDL